MWGFLLALHFRHNGTLYKTTVNAPGRRREREKEREARSMSGVPQASSSTLVVPFRSSNESVALSDLIMSTNQRRFVAGTTCLVEAQEVIWISVDYPITGFRINA